MSRFIDDLRRAGRLAMPWFVAADKRAQWERHAAQLLRIIRDDLDIPVLLIDNVAAYYYEKSEQEYWDLREHFPNLAPPYPLFWVEHRFPKMIHSKAEGDTDLTDTCPGGRVGWLIFGSSREDVGATGVPDNVRWILSCEQFIDYNLRRDEYVGPHGTINLMVDAEGGLVEVPQMQSFAGPEYNEMMHKHMGWLHPPLLALSFMHCKNVTVVNNPVPVKVAKKYRAHHGFNPAAHKTLVIEPLKEILRNEGRSGEVGLAKALHICRGHFRDYRTGPGLFGKYHQLVWTPSTVRGTRGKAAPAREIEVKV